MRSRSLLMAACSVSPGTFACRKAEEIKKTAVSITKPVYVFTNTSAK